MGGKWLIAGVLAVLPLAVQAQDKAQGSGGPVAAVKAEYPARAVENVQALARQMYLYDQAAWHGTDAFQEQWGTRPTGQLRGYIVLPGDDDLLAAVFYGEQDGRTVEFARFDVRGSTVVNSTIYADDARPALSATGQRMAEARRAAMMRAGEERFALCNQSPPNTLVLPPDPKGGIGVYIMTPQTDGDSYPMGGHFRIDIDADGKATAARPFMKTCFPLSLKDMPEGDPVAAVLSHLLDPQPTEIHLFASYHLPMPLYVATMENDTLWVLSRGRVIATEPLDAADGD